MFKVGDRVRRIAMGGAVLPMYCERTVKKVEIHEIAGERIDIGGGFGWWNAYNFELVKPATTPHKHAEVIKAWADGAEIQLLCKDGIWYSILHPDWSTECDYRVKPEKKPDRIRYACHGEFFNGHWHVNKEHNDNLCATFDGETGKLKAVEMVK